MLLIVNFDETQTDEKILEAAARFGADLEESEHTSYLIKVLPTLIEGEVTEKTYEWQPISLIELRNGAKLNSLTLEYNLGSDYNQIGEELVKLAGLTSADEGWGWQERGTLVIFPPHNPAIATFVGHSLVHYAHHSENEQDMLIVTSYEPLLLNIWD